MAMAGAPDRFTHELQRACLGVAFHRMLLVLGPDFHRCFAGSCGFSRWGAESMITSSSYFIGRRMCISMPGVMALSRVRLTPISPGHWNGFDWSVVHENILHLITSH